MTDQFWSHHTEYQTPGLDVGDVDPDPIAQFERWLGDAWASDVAEPHAFVVSTVDADGLPDARVVLVRKVDADSLVFYTNYRSIKGVQLEANPGAAATFAWLPLHRQVRMRGTVTMVSAAESDAYFRSRPRGSQLGAWASDQSAVLADRDVLERRWIEADEQYPDDVPRPSHWGGYRLTPTIVELWQGRPSRLHDRIRYSADDDGWTIERLAP
ncbi:MAG: pyridoxamine 5'-phosphate oxidase [Acidimicrobiia bacterium]|nr:pyridoxamine 5'-phosphate oxidase [Acidimicrobiia bacterium]